MQPYSTPSLVRADQRYTCSFGAVLRPVTVGAASDAGEAVALGRSAGEGDGTVKAVVVDLSRGGLGVSTPIFFPRGSHIDVCAKLPDGSEQRVVGRVQRVEMRDRKPTYYLGLSLVQPDEAGPVLELLMTDLRRGAVGVVR